ncbi:MAG: ABC transporter ATP-binding protein, partial [Bacteroidetes bacterium]|nr:ABC transporter ATP-binding protein [Bacteroidota bacterium]
IINYSFISFDDSNESSQVNLDSLSKAANQFCKFIFKVAWGIPFYGLLFIVSLIYISLVSVWAGMSIVVASAFYVGLIWLNRENIEKLHTSEYQHLKEKGEVLNRSWNNRKFIKLSGSEKKITSESVETLGLFLDTKAELKRITKRIENWFFVWAILTTLFVVGVTLLFGEAELQQVWQLIISWGAIFLFAFYGLKNLLINYWNAKISFRFFYNRIASELSLEKNEKLVDGSNEVLPIKKLEAENIGFAFSGQIPVFQDIKFTAEIGEITAVYGATGSGKSVMVSILSRILPLQSGEITINNSSWSEINDFTWRKNTSTVLQPVQLLKGTVLENIGCSSKYSEPEKIISFCKEMGFDNFFKEFPNGYSTTSNNVSAGQKQLIAFAAALYRKPRLLLLDEPFVFMDLEMSFFCMELLHKIKTEMMIIIFTGVKKTKSKVDKFFVYKMIDYNYV